MCLSRRGKTKSAFCKLMSAAYAGLLLFEVYFCQASKSAVICPNDRQTEECFTLSFIFICIILEKFLLP